MTYDEHHAAYEKNRTWSDAYMPQVKAIVGPHLLVESSEFVDMKRAADLVVMRARNITIAVRLRRPEYGVRFINDFTLRSRLSSGHQTELSKIYDGWGDWMFYGRVNSDGVLWLWYLIDLCVFRSALLHDERRKAVKMRENIANTDGRTYFNAYDVRSFPDELLIAASHTPEQRSELVPRFDAEVNLPF